METKIIQPLEKAGQVSTCPACGYIDGFHVSFSFAKHEQAEIILICPSCHQHFGIDWRVNLKEKDYKETGD